MYRRVVPPSPFHKSLTGYRVKSAGGPCKPGQNPGRDKCVAASGNSAGSAAPRGAAAPEANRRPADDDGEDAVRMNETGQRYAGTREDEGRETPEGGGEDTSFGAQGDEEEIDLSNESGPRYGEPKKRGFLFHTVVPILRAGFKLFRTGKKAAEVAKKANEAVREKTAAIAVTAARKYKQLSKDKRDENEIAADLLGGAFGGIKNMLEKWLGHNQEAEHGAQHEGGVSQTHASVATMVLARLLVAAKKYAGPAAGALEKVLGKLADDDSAGVPSSMSAETEEVDPVSEKSKSEALKSAERYAKENDVTPAEAASRHLRWLQSDLLRAEGRGRTAEETAELRQRIAETEEALGTITGKGQKSLSGPHAALKQRMVEDMIQQLMDAGLRAAGEGGFTREQVAEMLDGGAKAAHQPPMAPASPHGKSLAGYPAKAAGGPCKQGQTAAKTGCTPVEGGGGKNPTESAKEKQSTSVYSDSGSKPKSEGRNVQEYLRPTDVIDGIRQLVASPGSQDTEAMISAASEMNESALDHILTALPGQTKQRRSQYVSKQEKLAAVVAGIADLSKAESSAPKKRVPVDKVFTTGQVAKLMGVRAASVSKWFDQGRLQGYRIPGSQDRRIPAGKLVRFMIDNAMPVPDELYRDAEPEEDDAPPDPPKPPQFRVARRAGDEGGWAVVDGDGRTVQTFDTDVEAYDAVDLLKSGKLVPGKPKEAPKKSPKPAKKPPVVVSTGEWTPLEGGQGVKPMTTAGLLADLRRGKQYRQVQMCAAGLEKNWYTDGRVLFRVDDKERDALIAKMTSAQGAKSPMVAPLSVVEREHNQKIINNILKDTKDGPVVSAVGARKLLNEDGVTAYKLATGDDHKVAIDGKYYETIVKRYPNAQFRMSLGHRNTPNAEGPVLVYDGDVRVGLIMPFS